MQLDMFLPPYTFLYIAVLPAVTEAAVISHVDY